MFENGSVGVVIGRFQVDELHEGHHALIRSVMEKHPRLLILVGDRKTPPTATNPLSYTARETMLRASYPEATILPLHDYATNEAWSRTVDRAVDAVRAGDDAVIYSGRDGCLPHYIGKHKTVELQTGIENVTATRCRETVAQNPHFDNLEFRRGIVYAYQHLPHRTYHTVDIAVLRKADTEYPSTEKPGVMILLARKEDEKEWRFPGGFVEPTEKFVEAAARELREETGLNCEGGLRIVDEFIIDDWRLRGAKGVNHKTVLCVGWYSWGKPVASDDIAEVRWFNLDEVLTLADTMMVKEHRVLMLEGIKKFINE